MKAMYLLYSYGAIKKQVLYDDHNYGAIYTKGGYVWAYKSGNEKATLTTRPTNTKLMYWQAKRALRKHMWELDWEEIPEAIKKALGLN
jgi:hypothetical protein